MKKSTDFISLATERIKSSFARVRDNHSESDPHIFISLAVEKEKYELQSQIKFGNELLPLAGLTFAAKDNIDCAGMATTAACPSWSRSPSTSATVIQRLEDAGAVCVGKTNMDQFATGLVGTRSPYGVPTNPLNPELVPGGSSSGSAVAVARGLVDFSLGTDTAGSGRVPAAHNGIVGLKPSRGLISTTGVLPAVRSIDCVSIFARTITEAWSVFEQARGFDSSDPFSRTLSVAGFNHSVRRIGIPSELEFDTPIDQEAWTSALNQLTDAELIEIDISPMREAAEMLYNGPWVAERYAAVGEFLETQPADADEIVASIIKNGKDIRAVEAFESSYRLAAITKECEKLWSQMDFLLVPSVPGLATLAEVAEDPVGRNSRLGMYTNWVNLLDQCALTVPTAKRRDGMPGSVTLIGPAGADAALAANAAKYYEAPLAPAQAETDAEFLNIAVVGAHLSGQPLNWQLTNPGGVLVSQTHTSPTYRLYAIANSTPAKPALVHAHEGAGAKIAIEIWRLPIRAVGELLAQIPAPLGLGSLELEDGTSVHGFIAEPRAQEGAIDITSFGGWKTYLASIE